MCFLFLKAFLLTSVVVILLQVKIGDGTVEDHTIIWLEGSSMTRPLHRVVSGGVLAIRDLWMTFTGNIKTPEDTIGSRSQPSQRLQFKRSPAHRAKMAEKKLKDQMRKESMDNNRSKKPEISH